MVLKPAVISGNTPYPALYNVVGASFRTLGVEEREIFARFNNDEPGLLSDLIAACQLTEAAVISTCNRFEIVSVRDTVFDADTFRETSEKILGFIESTLGRKFRPENFYFLSNTDAVRHLFRVTSSLDSMVLGETQIFGQIKDSYKKAVTAGSVGRYLHHLFQFSFRLAKKIRSNTSIADKGVSVSYVAVRLAEQIFGSFDDRSVMIIGSGQMAELAAIHLKAHGCNDVIVANRTLDRAFELANKIGGSAISLADIDFHLPKVDVVIGSLANIDRPVIEAASLKKIRRQKPIFILDLGVPRNFPAVLGEQESVYLYNIDDLSSIVDENKSLREEAAREAEVIIEYGLFQFEKWLLKVSAEPAILDFRRKVKSACESELKDFLRAHGHAADDEKLLDELSYKISQKIAHDITNLLTRLPDGKIDQQSLLPFLFDEYLKLT